MRKASKVLGIIGSVLAIIFALIFLAYGAFVTVIGSIATSPGGDDGILGGIIKAIGRELVDFIVSFSLVIVLGSIAGAVLGFIGAAKLKKSGIVAGILFIIAAALSVFTVIGVIASILFIIAGIFALIREKKAEAPAA